MIAAPNSATRLAMVSSSKTTLAISRPPVRLRMSADACIQTNRQFSRSGEGRATSTHAGHPDDLPVAVYDGVVCPLRPRNAPSECSVLVAFATCNKIELTGGKDVGNYLGQAYVELYKKIEEVIKAST